MDRPREYWSAVAAGIAAEDTKAGVFVKHRGSLGLIREAIFRHELRKETRSPLLIGTGFVCNPKRPDDKCSSQLDILVYDPTEEMPLYAIDEFVVVSSKAACCAIEVKTDLDTDGFDAMANISLSLQPFNTRVKKVKCFGFAFSGVRCDTFVRHLLKKVNDGAFWQLPSMITVHQQNYLAVRATKPPHSEATPRYFIFDFSKQGTSGQATAEFLMWYDKSVDEDLSHDKVWGRFQKLRIPDEAKISISNTGEQCIGPVSC